MEKPEEGRIWDYKLLLVIIGSILILFGSVYLFTRPAYWECFNFKDTGSIGDTIGGITAPIMNLIGAILIYISFKAQIKANKIQYTLLSNESDNQQYDRNYQVILELFRDLKDDFKKLEFREHFGKSAINLYISYPKPNWSKEAFQQHKNLPIYNEYKFIISEFDLIQSHLNSSTFREKEKNKLLIIIRTYYQTQLEYPSRIIITYLEKLNLEKDYSELLKTLNNLNGETLNL